MKAIKRILKLVRSKRGLIVALIAAVVSTETASPGSLASIVGEQWATKILSLFGIAVAATKIIDSTRDDNTD